MKRWQLALAGLAALLVLVFALLWYLPARWALPLLAPRLGGLQLEQVGGLLWDGHADVVRSPRGELLGAVQWRLDRRALLGDNRLTVSLQGSRLAFSGQMQGHAPGEVSWSNVRVRADLALLPPVRFPIGQPHGVLEGSIGHVQLHGNWPMSMDDTRLHWTDAALSLPHQGSVALGSLTLMAQATNGVIEGRLQDDGHGPLHIDGQLQLSPLGRRFDADAAPRTDNSALQRWLSAWGRTDAQGTTHIRYRGGLAAAIPQETP